MEDLSKITKLTHETIINKAIEFGKERFRVDYSLSQLPKFHDAVLEIKSKQIRQVLFAFQDELESLIDRNTSNATYTYILCRKWLGGGLIPLFEKTQIDENGVEIPVGKIQVLIELNKLLQNLKI